MQIIAELSSKPHQKSNTNQLLTTETLLNRGMTVEECKIMCTHHSIDLREIIFFRIIYETQLRPFEVLNLLVEQWDRKQGLVTALKVKQKTKPRKGDHHEKAGCRQPQRQEPLLPPPMRCSGNT
jgi:site-specific recombinase XerD